MFANRLKQHGINPRGGRNTAFIRLASELPAAVLADLLAVDVTTATRWAKYAQTGLAHLPRRTPDSGGSVELGDADVPPHADRVRLYRNARLPYRSSETSSPTGRRVVGPYLPIGQPRGITAHGVTFHGRPRARLASSLLHSGTVISAAPNPAARAASKRFCTAG